MSLNVPANPFGGVVFPAPGPALGVGNVVGATKLAEKTIELTTCSQFGFHCAAPMVWFGLTQKQERQYGFDAATNLGGHAFILQFKVSASVRVSGTYAAQRRFACQHQQMQQLRHRFGNMNNACFYFLPDIGTFNDLINVSGDVLGNSFLVDVATLPPLIPPTHRANGYHYAYLNAAIPQVTITSEPFKPDTTIRASDWARTGLRDRGKLVLAKRLIILARELETANERLADMFFRNAALVVLP